MNVPFGTFAFHQCVGSLADSVLLVGKEDLHIPFILVEMYYSCQWRTRLTRTIDFLPALSK